MHTQDSGITHALNAWEAWNHLGFVKRSDRLKSLSAELPQTRDISVKSLLRSLLDLSVTLEPIQIMPGPTGESNELYLNGRGVALIIGDDSASKTAMVGQVIAALATGNCVLLQWNGHSDWVNDLVEKAHMFGLPTGVIQALPEMPLEQALALESISLVAAVASKEKVRQMNRLLAQRDGLLVQLIAETDAEHCSNLLQPDHLLRFVTERTRTINTTAVGGNATLLELGSTEL